LEEFLEFIGEVLLKCSKKGYEYHFGSFRGELEQYIVTKLRRIDDYLPISSFRISGNVASLALQFPGQ
jgi:hypothetical protein